MSLRSSYIPSGEYHPSIQLIIIRVTKAGETLSGQGQKEISKARTTRRIGLAHGIYGIDGRAGGQMRANSAAAGMPSWCNGRECEKLHCISAVFWLPRGLVGLVLPRAYAICVTPEILSRQRTTYLHATKCHSYGRLWLQVSDLGCLVVFSTRFRIHQSPCDRSRFGNRYVNSAGVGPRWRLLCLSSTCPLNVEPRAGYSRKRYCTPRSTAGAHHR